MRRPEETLNLRLLYTLLSINLLPLVHTMTRVRRRTPADAHSCSACRDPPTRLRKYMRTKEIKRENVGHRCCVRLT